MTFSNLQNELINTIKQTLIILKKDESTKIQCEHIESTIISMLDELINKKYYFYVYGDPEIKDKKLLLYKYEHMLVNFWLFNKSLKGEVNSPSLGNNLLILYKFLNENSLDHFPEGALRPKKLFLKDFNDVYDYPHFIPESINKYLNRKVEEIDKNYNGFYLFDAKPYIKNETVLNIYGLSEKLKSGITDMLSRKFGCDYFEIDLDVETNSIYKEYSRWFDEIYNFSAVECSEEYQSGESDSSGESNQSKLTQTLNNALKYSPKSM